MGEDARRKRSKWDDDRGAGRDRDDRARRTSSSARNRWDDRRDERRSRDRSSVRARSRSPRERSSTTPAGDAKKLDPAAAAAAAAAKINASIQAKRGIQHVDVPPILSGTSTSASPPASSNPFNTEMYIADGDYIKDIEVNDLRNRYTLTKGATQKMIKEETGADVTTRGAYYPDKSMATAANPPLYLHVTSTTKDGLDKAIVKIEELMKQELPNLVDERRFRRRDPPEQVERDEYGRRKWPEEKVFVNLESIPGFNLRASVVGPRGQYVKHIQQETRCRVQIKGRGSDFREHGQEQESDEPLHLHVTGPDAKEVERAKGLCEDLIASVTQQYEDHKSQPQPARFPGYGGGMGNVYVPTAPNAGTPPPPPGGAEQPPPPSTSPPGSDPYGGAYAQYYQNGADPYAAYGGYQAYLQYCHQAYYGQQGQAAPGTAVPPGTGSYGSYGSAPGV